MEYFFKFLLLPWTPGYPRASCIITLIQFMFHAYFINVLFLKITLKESKHVAVVQF